MYLIKCWNCGAEYDALEAPFCNHSKPTKICPYCFHCFCDAPEEYKKNFYENCPKDLLEEKLILENRISLRLGEALIKAGKITKRQLWYALKKQNILNKKIGEIFIMMDLLTPEELQLYLLDQNKINEINLKNFNIDYTLIEKIGKDFCISQKIIPIEIFQLNDQPILRFAFSPESDLMKLKTQDELKRYRLIPYTAKKSHIEQLIEKIEKGQNEDEVILLEKDEDYTSI